MRKYILVLFSVGFASTAWADTNWFYVTVSTTQAVWYVDLSSIREISDGYGMVKKAWVKIDYSHDRTVTARETRELLYFRCNEEQSKIVSAVDYDADGVVKNSNNYPYATYQPVVPDSVASSVMKVVCES